MPEVTVTLESNTPTNGIVTIPVPGLNVASIIVGSGQAFVNDVKKKVMFATDPVHKTITVINHDKQWAKGTTLLVTWDEEVLEGAGGGTGPAGPAGPQGEVGPIGPEGPEGPAGADGADGATGPAGPKGDTGDTGVAGTPGVTGPAGPKGDTGATGPAGPKGDTGATGPAGPEGPAGADGTGGGTGVPATGGTFTGPVVFAGSDVDSFAMVIDTPNAADGCSIQGRSAGIAKWEISLGGPDADANFAISRYPTWESEFPQDSPMVIYRATGFIKLIIPECADSPAAGVAGVPIGGLYQLNGTVKIRTY